MSDQDSIFEALAVLVQQNREQDADIAELKALVANADARLNAQFHLIEQLRRPSGVPSLHPVWRKEAA